MLFKRHKPLGGKHYSKKIHSLFFIYLKKWDKEER